jgi:hypothetical protein
MNKFLSVIAIIPLYALAAPLHAAPVNSIQISFCPTPGCVPPPGPMPVLGQPVHLWIFALDATGHAATNYANTISFTSSDSTATLPATHTFTESDASILAFTVTINSLPPGSPVAGLVSVTATDSSNLTSQVQFAVQRPAGGSVAQTPFLSAPLLLVLAMLLGLPAALVLRSRPASQRRQVVSKAPGRHHDGPVKR